MFVCILVPLTHMCTLIANVLIERENVLVIVVQINDYIKCGDSGIKVLYGHIRVHIQKFLLLSTAHCPLCLSSLACPVTYSGLSILAPCVRQTLLVERVQNPTQIKYGINRKINSKDLVERILHFIQLPQNKSWMNCWMYMATNAGFSNIYKVMLDEV